MSDFKAKMHQTPISAGVSPPDPFVVELAALLQTGHILRNFSGCTISKVSV